MVQLNPQHYLLGYLFGDGSINAQQVRLYGTVDDLPRVDWAAKQMGVVLRPNWRLGLQPNRKVATWVATWPQRCRNLLGDLTGQRQGLLPIGLHENSVLAGLWDSDGCVYAQEREARVLQGKVCFSSAKGLLVDGVVNLLRDLAFEPAFNKGMNWRQQPYGEVRVGKREWPRFLREIPLQERKARILRGLCVAEINVADSPEYEG